MRRRTRLLTGYAGLAALVASTVGVHAAGAVGTGQRTDAPAPTTATVKAQLPGTASRAALPRADAYRKVVDTYVLNLNWKDVQTSIGGGIVPNNPIDRALANPAGRPVKVRLFAGTAYSSRGEHADSALTDGELQQLGRVRVCNDQAPGRPPACADSPRFWTSTYPTRTPPCSARWRPAMTVSHCCGRSR